MSEAQWTALAALRFNWSPVPDDVWRPSPFHVEGLHPAVIQDVLAGLADAVASSDASPIGLVLQGRKGSGKTHLLGWIRRQVQQQGGYFCLIGLMDTKGFWGSVLGSMLDSLARPVPESEIQLRLLLRRLSTKVGSTRASRRAVMGETDLTPATLETFIDGLRDFDDFSRRESEDVARALALSASGQSAHRDVAEDFFASAEETRAGERSQWGIRRKPWTPEEIIRGLSHVMALTGPTVLAVDQVDTLIAQAAQREDNADDGPPLTWQQQMVIEQIAGGLMTLREYTRRSLTVVACLHRAWVQIEKYATSTVQDRFRTSATLREIRDPELAREIVEKRFAVQFKQIRFVPPYPTWPVRPSAFAEAVDYTPRQLLIRIDNHIRDCLVSGEIRELTHLGEPSTQHSVVPVPVPDIVAAHDIARFDARFEELKRAADVTSPLDPDAEDATVPELLAAGLSSWIIERGEDGRAFSQDPPPSANPALHARLRRTLDENSDDEEHWCFRAISDRHHGVAALNRMRRAQTAAGLDRDVKKRKLFLLRNFAWSTAPKTQELLSEFEEAGGETLGLDTEDLRILSALKTLLAEAPVELESWLRERKPTANIALFQHTLPGPDTWHPPSVPGSGPERVVDPRPPATAGTESPFITLGRCFDNGEPARVRLEVLRKHVVIFAGSGSGKTVLIRRLIEECALQGVSSIVLDPNNDLARLGDPWPEPPPQWGDGDAARATEYLARTEVIVWTPRRESGRPLTFQPLPDFKGVLDDPDEFNEAVDAAVAALVPRAKLNSRTNRAHLGLAVLRKAVEYHGRYGRDGLRGLIDTLSDLPDGVSDLQGGHKIASELSQTLIAAMDNDPLLGGDGTPVDPAVLLTPGPGKRARVSVISLVGLPAEESRQSFVNQLQMALFAWIKRRPAGDRPLLGLLVMDEAQTLAPSGPMTPCTQSTLALASQARKYGLGLVFATQAPKGLHNRIPGNATTQLFGLLNSPTHVEAAREMARAKDSDVHDIARLGPGEFYLATEGTTLDKVRTSMCLSHHPRSPLTTEEVMDRACGRGPA